MTQRKRDRPTIERDPASDGSRFDAKRELHAAVASAVDAVDDAEQLEAIIAAEAPAVAAALEAFVAVDDGVEAALAGEATCQQPSKLKNPREKARSPARVEHDGEIRKTHTFAEKVGISGVAACAKDRESSGRRRKKSTIGTKHPPATKLEAVRRYAAGDSLQEIADRLGVAPQTLRAWRASGVPVDWERHRQQTEQEIIAETTRRLASRKASLNVDHFQRWRALDKALERALFVVDAAGDVALDPNGERVPRELEPRQLAALSEVMVKIQAGQRLVFGGAGHMVGVQTEVAPLGPMGLPDDIPDDLIRKLDAVLVAASSDPGPIEDEDEA